MDMVDFSTSWAFTKIYDYVFNLVKSEISPILNKETQEDISCQDICDEICKIIPTGFNERSINESVDYYCEKSKKWSDVISFDDMAKTRKLWDIYIELDLDYTIRRNRYSKNIEERIKLSKIVNQVDNHLVILGDPGAGKTTSIKALCSKLAVDSDLYPSLSRRCIVIRLRELNIQSSTKPNLDLYDVLLSVFGISLNSEYRICAFFIEKLKKRLIHELLNELKLLVIFDGYDEIVSTYIKKYVINDFMNLCLSVDASRLILTSRVADFCFNIENAEKCQLCPLTTKQINSFIRKWFKGSKKYRELIRQINDSPYYDVAMRPLTLAHLCAIFQRENMIPEKPKYIYRKIVGLLVSEWDKQNIVTRNTFLSDFTEDKKMYFLSYLAFELTRRFNKTIFNEKEMHEVYEEMSPKFNMQICDWFKIINDIEVHTGLLVKTSYLHYEFAHKSIQEYLAAYYIDLVVTDLQIKDFINFPDILAIVTALSASPMSRLLNILELYENFMRYRESSDDYPFYSSIIKRLALEKPDFVIYNSDFYSNGNGIDNLSLLIFIYDRLRYGKNVFIENDDIKNKKISFLYDICVKTFDVLVENSFKYLFSIHEVRESYDILKSNYCALCIDVEGSLHKNDYCLDKISIYKYGIDYRIYSYLIIDEYLEYLMGFEFDY